MTRAKELSLFHTWGTLRFGAAGIQGRVIALVAGFAVWFIATLQPTGTHGLVALAFNVAAVVFVACFAWMTRTVSLQTVATFFFLGGLLMGVALFAGNQFAVSAGAEGAIWRPWVVPPMEEILKILPIAWIVWQGRKFTTWTYAATDLLFLGTAVGAGFAFVEDAYRHAAVGLHEQATWMLPASEIVTIDGQKHFLAGHCIWTGLAAGTIGLAILWRHHKRFASILAVSGLAVAIADHVAVNYALSHPEMELALKTINIVSGYGYISVGMYIGCFVLAVVADRWALAVALPKVPEFSIPKDKERKDTLSDSLDFLLDRRRLAYAFYKLKHADLKSAKDAALVVAILMQRLINYHTGRERVPEEQVNLPLDPSQVATKVDSQKAITLLPTSWDESGVELDLPERFHVVGLISEGGMGAIYKAKHLMTGAKIAIKVLHPHLARQATNVKRFEQEARAASALSHPNLVVVYDYGTTPKNIPFLVMELIEGVNLSQTIRDHGALPIDRLLVIFWQAADALAHAHKRGVVHRDIKPSNMILTATDDGTDFIRIVDFGIAKLTAIDGAATQELTKTGDIMGSPMYMSPEQCLGEALDARSDIYSLGCVMYEALTGQPPFLGSNAVQTIFKHINEMPRRPRDVRKDLHIPGELEGVLFRTLQKEPNQRYANMDEVRNDLDYVKKIWTGQRLENLWSGDVT